MGLDVFDIVAVILGVIFTIRKLDAQRREPEEFVHVPRDEFLAWRDRETLTYTVGMSVCFAKVLAKMGLAAFMSERVDYGSLRLMGAAVDLSWFVVTLAVLFFGYRLALQRARLRIVLGGFIVANESSLSRELKDAIAELKAGELQRAQYHLNQITLDADESLKAIALYYLGESYRLQGKLEEAKDAFVESLEVDPSLKQPQEALAKLRKES